MPAYFSLTFELKKDPNAICVFCEALVNAGLTFKSGYWGFENDSFDDIVTWNQNKLNENFALGYTEHHSHDYKQMQFNYCDFSEIRVYIMNYRRTSNFVFHLIVPEDDLVDFVTEGESKYTVHRKTEKMDLLKSLARKVWGNTDILAIQTGWEGSDVPPLAKEISSGTKPQTEPFCIVKAALFKEGTALAFEKVERGGILIKDDKEWNYL